MGESLERDVATLRAFNRTYTARLGLLAANYDGSPFTLSEARVLYELANRPGLTAAEMARTLGLDPAQLSRTLRRFADRDIVDARENPAHGRHQLLSLTDQGRAAFDALEARTRANVGSLLESLHPLQRGRLLDAAQSITVVFEEGPATPLLRGLRPGDLGAVVARQAILYAAEYGWNGEYEALAARILADFQRDFDPAKDDAWIATVSGRMVGSVFLAHGDDPRVAKLRLLFVESEARGMGVGKLLVATCVERARELGYARLDLWTQSILVAARGVYRSAGFDLVAETPHRAFGHDLVGETWSLALV